MTSPTSPAPQPGRAHRTIGTVVLCVLFLACATTNESATKGPNTPSPTKIISVDFGIDLRETTPEEQQYFRSHPEVLAQSTRDGRVIANPFAQLEPGPDGKPRLSPKHKKERSQAILRERTLLFLHQHQIRPAFRLSPEQKKTHDAALQGSEDRELLFLALLIVDPSRAPQATSAQKQQAEDVRRRMELVNHQARGKEPLNKWEYPWATTESHARDQDTSSIWVQEIVGARPGMHIVDVGAGAGYFTFKFAQSVGPTGAVLATEIDPDMVAHMERERSFRKMEQVKIRLVTEADPGLPTSWSDVILLVNVHLFWSKLDHHSSALLDSYFQALKPGGRLIVYQDYLFGGAQGVNCYRGSCESLSFIELSKLATKAGFRVGEHRVPNVEPVKNQVPGFLAEFIRP
ncbi:MAG: hypothetical protein CMH54_13830 [Myxococcales bacterium]|nr:hypothetical protein [Myxococcales bacterium]